MLWNITVNDAGSEYDPLTLLRSRTTFGRPDWKTIYTRMRQAIDSGHYLPGASSQLKTKVGVRVVYVPLCIILMAYLCSYSHTSVAQAAFPRPSKRLATSAPLPM